MGPRDMLAHKAQAAFAPRADDEPVPSPCISVCRMTPDRSHCEGCFRTIDEIRAWSKSDTPQRLVIWHALLERAGLAAADLSA
ncbi:DUF1289 domain-containing protein [Delftia tsuruhatensis]|uniref:DUF1289 domain-containing protein n=1 Tax=Delftia tsuruhatensis TaxID=180282 RepID=UPI001F328359|nr:DUF1289 domain-containing protein [Delftia tsuruhatensis]